MENYLSRSQLHLSGFHGRSNENTPKCIKATGQPDESGGGRILKPTDEKQGCFSLSRERLEINKLMNRQRRAGESTLLHIPIPGAITDNQRKVFFGARYAFRVKKFCHCG